MDIRLGIEHLTAWLHNYDVQHQEGHKQRVLAAKKRFQRLQAIASNPEMTEDQRFATLFAYARKIEPMIFEELVLIAFKAKGFMVRGNAAYTGDGGIDGRVWVEDWRQIDPWFSRRHPNRIVRGWAGIQCKRYEGAVRREHIRQFPYDLAKAELVAGLFVHTGTTPKARPGSEQSPSPEDVDKDFLPPVRILSGRSLIALLTGGKHPNEFGRPAAGVGQ